MILSNNNGSFIVYHVSSSLLLFCVFGFSLLSPEEDGGKKIIMPFGGVVNKDVKYPSHPSDVFYFSTLKFFSS